MATRHGRTRFDAALTFWTLPWTLLRRCARPLSGLLGFAWAGRPVVAAIAIVQGLSQPALDLEDVVTAAGIGVLLALTYVSPACTRALATRELDVLDRLALAYGLGPDLATYLRGTQPVTVRLLERTARLGVDQTPAPRPRLRLVTSAG